MKIERKFTEAGKDAYASIEFVKTSSEIRNPDGSVVFKLDNVEVPANATNLLQHLVANRAMVPAKYFVEEHFHINPGETLKMIASGNDAWEANVPQAIVDIIKANKLFDYGD